MDKFQELERFCCRTHDVYHGKGVNTKMQKNGPLVSRGYREAARRESAVPGLTLIFFIDIVGWAAAARRA